MHSPMVRELYRSRDAEMLMAYAAFNAQSSCAIYEVWQYEIALACHNDGTPAQYLEVQRVEMRLAVNTE